MNSDNPLSAIALVAEEKIREAMAERDFDNLPGAGKPLPLDDDSHLPPDVRMARKILKNAGYLEENGNNGRKFGIFSEKNAPKIADEPEKTHNPGLSTTSEADRHSRLKRFTLMMARIRRERAASAIRLPRSVRSGQTGQTGRFAPVAHCDRFEQPGRSAKPDRQLERHGPLSPPGCPDQMMLPEDLPDNLSLLEAALLDKAQDSPYLEKILDRMPGR